MSFYRKQLGQSGEDLAAKYLEKRGFKIIERNFRLKLGEIDILARNGDFIVLVEVKTKTNFNQGSPEEKVDYFKQRKLRLLARAIEQMYPKNNIRIDVVAVDMSNDRPRINHIVSAVEN
jgi:putative endonuclease